MLRADTPALRLILPGIVAALLLAGSPARGQAPTADLAQIGERTVELLQEYLRIDTVNPPGNEIRAARFLARVLEREGIDYEVFEASPGRANVVARLRGDGSLGGGIVLLNHTDVVPADERFWSTPPFAGEIVNGQIVGRGAVDMKGYGLVQLMAMVALKRSGLPLGRDVVFLATAAEETGGQEGAGYVVGRRPELLRGVEFVLTEGGSMRRIGGRTAHFVEVTQKTPLWLRLRASGVAGHGSQAIRDSAANRLVRALERIRTYRPQIRLVPPVAEMLRASAPLSAEPERARALGEIERHLGDPVFMDLLAQQYGNLLRNTIAITVLEGSSKTNVISSEAVAELDCRLLPGENPDLFLATLRDVIDDPDIRIETLLRFGPSRSPADTALWRAIEEVARRRDPQALLVPSVVAGFTDAHYFREKGIVAYGWSPLLSTPSDGAAHGVNESVSVDAVRRAPGLLYDVLVLLAGARTST